MAVIASGSWILLASALCVADAASASAAPAWCKDAAFKGTYSGSYDLKDLASPDHEKVLVTFVQAACTPTPEAEAHRAEIDRNRQAWGKRLGMGESDWADVVEFASQMPYDRGRVEFSTKVIAQFTPLDQYKAITDGFQLPNGNGAFKDAIYIADVFGDGLSEVARFGYIEECLKASGSVTSKAPPAAEWAVCQDDIDKLDMAKFYEQLRTDTAHSGSIKTKLRLASLQTKEQLKAHAADVAAAHKRDPVYKKMFEVAAAGRAAWASGLASQAKLLELAQQLDSAVWSQSRSQFADCEAKTAEALAAAVAKVPASTFKAMKDKRFDPFGGFVAAAGPVLLAIPEVNLAAIPYVLCQPKTGTANFLASAMREAVTYRGPRTTALTKLLGETFTPDDMNEHLQWPSSRRMYGGGSSMSAGGVVDSVKVEGDVLRVTLEKMIVKVNECTKKHSTNHIYRVYPDGRVQYDEVCDAWGTVTHDQQWADFKVKKQYEPLLKKGVKFSSVNGDGQAADVVVLWPDKTTEAPSWLVGAKVK